MAHEDIAQRVVDSYEIIGERHGSQALDSVYSDYYERPVMQSLLGNVEGKVVLDAGCGPGCYAERLVAQGARVLALDSSPKMVWLARRRLGGSASVQQADLNEPLDFIETGSFDTVLCALVLDYIKDWDRLFAEFNRVSVKAGHLVFSIHHPFFLDLKVEADIDDSYFLIQQVEEDWLVFGLKISAYRRLLGAIASTLWQTGFLIEQIVEPKPTEACMQVYPRHYAELCKHPVLLCISARKG